MFVGHLAVALGAKRVEPRLPLAALASAAFGLDLLWPAFVLAGVEVVRIEPGNTAFTPLNFVSYPWSHSLLMSLVWAALAGFVTARVTGRGRAGVLIAALVVSHWVLDVVSHRPDMPLWPGGPLLGLELWRSIPATLIVEGAMLAAGLVIYIRAAPAEDAVGHWAFAGLVGLIITLWLLGPFSPPPPNVTAIAATGLLFPVLTVPWMLWIERHRTS